MNQKEEKIRFVYEFKIKKNNTYVEMFRMYPRTYEYLGSFKKTGIEEPSRKELDFFWQIHNILSRTNVQRKYFEFFLEKNSLLRKFSKN